jgi:hypothetical protein
MSRPSGSLAPAGLPAFRSLVASLESMSARHRPSVELLWWSGCPSTERALSELRAAMDAAGLDPSAIRTREIVTEAQAGAEGFVGSPTVRVDGRDVSPPGDEPAGLTCRVYRLRDGRFSPTPDPQDLRDALRALLP